MVVFYLLVGASLLSSGAEGQSEICNLKSAFCNRLPFGQIRT